MPQQEDNLFVHLDEMYITCSLNNVPTYMWFTDTGSLIKQLFLAHKLSLDHLCGMWVVDYQLCIRMGHLHSSATSHCSG